MIRFAFKLIVVVAVVAWLTACAETRYVKFDKEGEKTVFPYRTVAVEMDAGFHEEYPDCVVVMPPKATPGLERFPDLVETSLGLQLTRKISRVVGATERDRAARRMAFDLVHPGDREALVEAMGCDAYVDSTVAGPGRAYLVVWSQVRIGIEVKMVRARDGQLLWRARHVANRSEGGLPFTPIGVVVDGYSSARFSADREIVDSVVDDAVRRIVASLPNARMVR
jgi:hypothetical protein